MITALAPRASAALSSAGRIPRSSTATGSSARPARAQQIEQGRVAGVLDGDPVAGAQVRVEHALDRRPARR